MNKNEKILLRETIKHINKTVTQDIRIMEVCGTHTYQIARLGLKKLLTPKIHLISGPGCPVCVTEESYIDVLIKLLERTGVIVAAFGDLLRVRGLMGTLEEMRAIGKKVAVIYSPEDILQLAKSNPNDHVIFAAVGFETTAPLYAALVKTAAKEGIHNLYLLTSLKRMEPAIRYILEKTNANIDGMLCPGHVAAITGISPFLPITEEYNIPAAICGFEAMDLVGSTCALVDQIFGVMPIRFLNLYRRCVKDDGNQTALHLIDEVYEISDESWRGIGEIKDSGYKLNRKYKDYDAEKTFGIKITTHININEDCECGKILLGEKTPNMCTHFAKGCTPDHPIGPCMISAEGACSTYYKFRGIFHE